MKKVILSVILSILCLPGYSQDTGKVVVTPFVCDSEVITGDLVEIMDQKMEQVALQNGLEVGNSRFVLASVVKVKEKSMTATVPQKCVVELSFSLYIVDMEQKSIVSQMSSKLTGIESSEGKAIYKALSRMNVRTSQIRKFVVVSKDKIIAMEDHTTDVMYNDTEIKIELDKILNRR